jgi:hypothetical protein
MYLIYIKIKYINHLINKFFKKYLLIIMVEQG